MNSLNDVLKYEPVRRFLERSSLAVALAECDPFQDAVPCWQLNNSGRWDGWGERSRWEPDYANDDEREEARRRNADYMKRGSRNWWYS